METTEEEFVDFYEDQRRQAVLKASHAIMQDVILHSVLPRYLWDSHMTPLAVELAEKIYPKRK